MCNVGGARGKPASQAFDEVSSAYTSKQNVAKQMTVSHHGLNGIGNKTISNHHLHDQPLRDERGACDRVSMSIFSNQLRLHITASLHCAQVLISRVIGQVLLGQNPLVR